ncbi:MAG: hypothetical protein R3F49_17710 [Planctomycetota bacterium]
MNVKCTGLFVVLGLAPLARGQAPSQIFDPLLPRTSGEFGRAVGLSGSTLAIASEEWDVAHTHLGRILVYEKGVAGTWEYRQELTRQPHFSPANACVECFGYGIEIVGDSMLVKGSYRTSACWEFQRSAGVWRPHEQIGPNNAPELGGVGGMDYDGETLLIGYPDARDAAGQIVPVVRFWERHGTWTPVAEFRASDVGLLGYFPSFNWGLTVAISGDHAVVASPHAGVASNVASGVVSTFRRVNGVWQHEQTLRRPIQPDGIHYFGGAVAIDEDWLFVSCYWDVGRVGAIYVYARAANGTWELHSKIHPTANEATSLQSAGFGARLQWVPPTLAVTSANYRVPALAPNTSTGGAGSILLYELCDGVWDQRVGLTAPLQFGGGGLGLYAAGMSFDGHGIAAGAPFAFSAGQWHAGAAAYIEYTPPTPGPCREIGRPGCAPYDAETLDCPCGAVAAPGLGCPNAAGPGARLRLHGYFNEVEVRRAVVDGISPDSLVLLMVGQPVPSLLPAGQVAGDGVLCITPSTARRVGRSDGSGSVTFENVAVPISYSTQLLGFELPLQALYRAPLPGPCNARWNATNAFMLSISTLSYGL